MRGAAMTSAAIGGTSHTQASLVTLLREARSAVEEANQCTQCIREVITKLDQAIEALTKPNPDAQGFYWWLVAIGFAEGQVVDGIQLDAGTTHNMVRNTYQFIRGRDIRTKIIAQPSSEAIEKARSKPDG